MAVVLRTYPKIFPEKLKTFSHPVIEMWRFELGLLFFILISSKVTVIKLYDVITKLFYNNFVMVLNHPAIFLIGIFVKLHRVKFKSFTFFIAARPQTAQIT